jgi:hypothetical protein
MVKRSLLPGAWTVGSTPVLPPTVLDAEICPFCQSAGCWNMPWVDPSFTLEGFQNWAHQWAAAPEVKITIVNHTGKRWFVTWVGKVPRWLSMLAGSWRYTQTDPSVAPGQPGKDTIFRCISFG